MEDVSETLTTVPDGTEVFDWYFLITTDDLSRQSADLKGSDYGFNASVLSVNNFAIGDDVIVFNGKLKFLKQGRYDIIVYDVLGKQVTTENVIVNTNLIHELQLKSSGLYIVKITSGLTTKTVKVIQQ